MPSNKFNIRPVPTRRPAICKAPPTPPFLPVPIGAPRQLSGFARHTDLDPLDPDPPDFSGYIDLQKIDATPTYQGTTPKNTYHLRATVHLQTAPDVWHVYLELFKGTVYIPFIPPWTVQVTGPFDTGLLTNVTIPGQDFSLARFME